MDESVAFISIPAFPFFCNVVVFPSPISSTLEPNVFILKKTSEVPDVILGKLSLEYVPGSVYCLLPSADQSHGTVSVFKARPSFLKEYSYSLQINKESLDLVSCSSVGNLCKLPQKLSEVIGSDKCTGCFVSHFPSPNTSICKWKK